MISDNRHLAPGVDTKLLKANFAVVTDAVGALRLSVKSSKFPPTVNIVRSFSYFSGFTLHTVFAACYFFIFWDLCFGNENNWICPFYRSDTLGLLPQLICKGSSPNFPVRSFDQMSVFLGNSIYLMGDYIGAINEKWVLGSFLPLDIKLELGPSVSTLGGCVGCIVGGGTWTSWRIMCGP